MAWLRSTKGRERVPNLAPPRVPADRGCNAPVSVRTLGLAVRVGAIRAWVAQGLVVQACRIRAWLGPGLAIPASGRQAWDTREWDVLVSVRPLGPADRAWVIRAWVAHGLAVQACRIRAWLGPGPAVLASVLRGWGTRGWGDLVSVRPLGPADREWVIREWVIREWLGPGPLGRRWPGRGRGIPAWATRAEDPVGRSEAA